MCNRNGRNKKIKYNNYFKYSKFIYFKVQIFALNKLIRQDLLHENETWEMTDESFFPEVFIESKYHCNTIGSNIIDNYFIFIVLPFWFLLLFFQI
jgi:hypothetical protein